MSNGAQVESVDALKAFRIAMIKFAEAAHVALSDAEGEIHRTLTWLESEQQQFWQGQIRKRTELVAKAKDALRQKKLFKDSSGRTPSAVDEEKALALAMRRLEEAEQKFAAVRRYRGKLQKELDLYKGSVQRFATDVDTMIPSAVSGLDRMVQAIESYLALGPAGGQPDAAAALFSGFARTEETAPQQAPVQPPPLPGEAAPSDPAADPPADVKPA